MTRKLLSVAGLIVVLAVVATGCGDSDDTSTSTASAVTADQLAGRTFVAEEIDGQDLVEGSRIELTFMGDALAFNAGCNSMRAPVEVKDGRLRLTAEAAGTLMACEPALEKQDRWLAKLLQDGVKVTDHDGALQLEADGVTIPLQETKAPSGPPSVTDTTWALTGYGGADGKRTDVASGDQQPTLRMSNGESELFTGCNNGGGSAQVTDDGFVMFGPQRLTRMACTDPAGQKAEQAMTTVLDGKAAIGFENDQLVIAHQGDFLVFSAR